MCGWEREKEVRDRFGNASAGPKVAQMAKVTTFHNFPETIRVPHKTNIRLR